MKSGIADLFERPSSGTRALLVHAGARGEDPEREVEEFVELVRATGAEPAELVTAAVRRRDPRYFVGAGKAEELRGHVEAGAIELAIFNHRLTPAQERNLEALLKCRVLDRIGLILDIFAQRATSFEGRLQVELAQLRHLSTRLVRGWTHLERQRGGIGLRGPGETQLETDRRLVGKRIERIGRQLDAVQRRREVNRRPRRRSGVPVVSLVGYTNAGKSTLFNRLTGAGVHAADQLFATLDPTLRRMPLPAGSHLVLVDTVGFVGDLPHELVAAFRATLEETRQADLLLHVIDASGPDGLERAARVNEVLSGIDAGDLPQVEVMNKVDRRAGPTPGIERDDAGVVRRVWVSARTGAGIEALAAALGERFEAAARSRELHLPPGSGRLRARLYSLGAVLGERPRDDGGSVVEVRIADRDLVRLEAEANAGRPCEEAGAAGRRRRGRIPRRPRVRVS
ncbi:MAG: GTPase HflX [Immundisolibacterales bacterium]|nr:GTPase HflX [Immundisolibacterales bacterium]